MRHWTLHFEFQILEQWSSKELADTSIHLCLVLVRIFVVISIYIIITTLNCRWEHFLGSFLR